MPVMDGLAATREIRIGEMHLKTHVAIVAVTSNDNREECLLAGMDAHVLKPLRIKSLLEVLDEVVQPGAA